MFPRRDTSKHDTKRSAAIRESDFQKIELEPDQSLAYHYSHSSVTQHVSRKAYPFGSFSRQNEGHLDEERDLYNDRVSLLRIGSFSGRRL